MSIAPGPRRSLLDLAGERVEAPIRLLGWDDIEVTVDQECPLGLIFARNTNDHAGPARPGLEDLRSQVDLGQFRGNVLCGTALPRSGVVAVVGRVDLDELAAQIDDLVLGCDHWLATGLGHG
jgi:hypothetical protein